MNEEEAKKKMLSAREEIDNVFSTIKAIRGAQYARVIQYLYNEFLLNDMADAIACKKAPAYFVALYQHQRYENGLNMLRFVLPMLHASMVAAGKKIELTDVAHQTRIDFQSLVAIHNKTGVHYIHTGEINEVDPASDSGGSYQQAESFLADLWSAKGRQDAPGRNGGKDSAG